ncbi:hypothetical protein PCCS19_25320 [Paenibacillus sp. CCS19]|uniref:DUF58 domain-containing protein n=1 Tax=Paenibacillus sp. CCS19 TaxID=3158387 RepID=UPI002564C191|nr:DUF58 domain-containing protein [Paenibacillus cellulosilyticus]GMK39478.1 hypothetical protein PCCS19_25320 [Paenibacillus cellulosilyticus]
MSSGSSIPRTASAAKVNGTGRAASKPRLKEVLPAYRTRRWLWSLLAAGWMFTVSASALRGEMPELFAAVLLSGIVIVGLLPVIAVRAAGIEAVRTLSAPEAAAGGELQVVLTLRMRMPLPLLWVFVREECINESGGQQRAVHYGHVGLPWQRREWQIAYTIRELARGSYRYQAMEVTIGDAFGLTAMKRLIPVRVTSDEIRQGSKESPVSRDKAERPSFLVLPDWTSPLELPIGSGQSKKLMESRPLDASTGGYVHSTERTRSRSVPRQQTTVADGAGVQRQPYRPGDDPRHIDWRAASRGRSWVTKREPASQPPALLMLLDTAAEAYDGNDYWFDAAAGYAAAQIRYAVNNGVTFRLLGGMESTGGQQATRLSTQREALERLARMKPKPAPTGAAAAEDKGISGLDDALNREGVSRGATFLLITAEWRSGDLGERLAAYAAANGCRIEVHVLTSKRLPSAAMRARQRDWENAGIRVVWVPMPDSSDITQQTAIAEGGESNERASQ